MFDEYYHVSEYAKRRAAARLGHHDGADVSAGGGKVVNRILPRMRASPSVISKHFFSLHATSTFLTKTPTHVLLSHKATSQTAESTGLPQHSTLFPQ